jgi:predicted SprT family Zn-dependent metalloprotease
MLEKGASMSENRKREAKLIKESAQWWIHWLGLGYWDVTVHISDKVPKHKDKARVCGKSWVEWKYCSAYIEFYPKNMQGMTQSQIEVIVVHELLHVLVNEMREGTIENEERVVTMLQKAMVWVKNAHRDEGKQNGHKR